MTHRFRSAPALFGLALATLLTAGPTHAASCIGVEARVNAGTSALAGTVSGTVAGVQSMLLAQAQAEQQQLNSALAVLNRQTNLSSEAGITALTRGFEAASGSLTAQWQALALKEETERYMATGYEPCALQAKADRAADALARAEDWRAALRGAAANRIGAERTAKTRAAWFKRYGEKPPQPDDLLSGDLDRARAWVDFVMGPPEVLAGPGGAGQAMRAVVATEADLRRSAAVEGMAAASAPPTLAEVAGHWNGPDGGMAWSQGLAAGDPLGARRDLIQIKGAMAALQADRLQRRLARLEAMAADAAVRIDATAVPTGSAP